MPHQITQTDHLVLHREAAWHGLGTVVADAPSPAEALALARLDWRVEQWPLRAVPPEAPTESSTAEQTDPALQLSQSQASAQGSASASTPSPPSTPTTSPSSPTSLDSNAVWLPPGGMRAVNTHVLNVRGDTSQALGVVGAGFRPVQNAELAEFVAALGESGSVKIESAGSLRGGKRVWFLAKGESVWVNPRDEVRPYLLVANGHDGTLALTCQPTTIRVVCRNTLHASLKQGEQSTLTVRFRHEGAIADKLDDAKRALGLFDRARTEFAAASRALDAKNMKREELMQYWLEVYAATLEPIPAHPVTDSEKRAADQAKERLAKWSDNFDWDLGINHAGGTAWTALNAVTRWFDHQRPVRAASDAVRQENRVLGNWWGDAATAKLKAMEMALSR